VGTQHPTARQHVLVLVENLSVPTDRRVWQEARTLRQAGYEVTVICPQGTRADRLPYEVVDGVQIHRFPLKPATTGGGYFREYSTASARIGRLAGRLGRGARFEVVHASNPPDLLLLAALPLRRRGARFLFDHHDLVPELYLSRFGRRDPLYYTALLLERLTFALSDVVVSTNESYRRIALERGHKAPEDVFIVRNAPDLTRFRSGEADPQLRAGHAHLLAYVGVIGPQDGVDHAIRALAHLRRLRTDWRAVFVGDGDALSDVRALALELELDDHVEFLGWRGDNDIVRVLSTADVCLSPEPSSPLNDASTMMKVAEYMAMSRPVVAFDLPESRFTAGKAGLFAPSGDDEAFARAIDELLSSPERRTAMGKLGRDRVAGELSWKASERALLAAYERALGHKHG
jgi:glycosyltransferase involved in cell wall biosynthesis